MFGKKKKTINKEPIFIDTESYKSNIFNEEQTKEQIKNTLKIISDSISRSLGPYGSTTIIEDNNGEHCMSKDGYFILKNMNFTYEIPKTIHKIITNISKTLVRTVGDGSTSSVVVAHYLFDYLEELQKEFKLAPQDIINILNVTANQLENFIKLAAVNVTDENFDEIITKIASISTNNDEKTGKLICEIFKNISKFGFIHIEKSRTNTDTFELMNGIQINRGYINMIMANKPDKVSFEYEKPYVFMCNDMLSDDEMEKVATWMSTLCLKKDVPLVIIAQSYSESFKGFFHANLQKNHNMPIVAIDFDCSTKKGKERFDDLALALSCKPFDKFNGIDNINDWTEEDLGACKRVVGNDINTTFIGCYGCEEEKDKIDAKVKELQEKYQEIMNVPDNEMDHKDIELFRIQERIATLTSSMATIYVGGNSNLEKDTRKFLMEDAVFACKSCIENGYIVGGNLIVPKVIHKYKEYILDLILKDESLQYLVNAELFNKEMCVKLLETISECFLKSFDTVLENANITKEDRKDILNKCVYENKIFNVKLRKYEDDDNTLVINSCDTDIEIIKACFSIIGLLSTSNQFLTINPILSRQPK